MMKEADQKIVSQLRRLYPHMMSFIAEGSTHAERVQQIFKDYFDIKQDDVAYLKKSSLMDYAFFAKKREDTINSVLKTIPTPPGADAIYLIDRMDLNPSDRADRLYAENMGGSAGPSHFLGMASSLLVVVSQRALAEKRAGNTAEYQSAVDLLRRIQAELVVLEATRMSNGLSKRTEMDQLILEDANQKILWAYGSFPIDGMTDHLFLEPFLDLIDHNVWFIKRNKDRQKTAQRPEENSYYSNRDSHGSANPFGLGQAASTNMPDMPIVVGNKSYMQSEAGRLQLIQLKINRWKQQLAKASQEQTINPFTLEHVDIAQAHILLGRISKYAVDLIVNGKNLEFSELLNSGIPFPFNNSRTVQNGGEQGAFIVDAAIRARNFTAFKMIFDFVDKNGYDFVSRKPLILRWDLELEQVFKEDGRFAPYRQRVGLVPNPAKGYEVLGVVSYGNSQEKDQFKNESFPGIKVYEGE